MILYTESTFPRASRDDCTRCAGSVQGPFYDVTSQGHRAVLLVCIVGMVGVLGALLMGWL